VLLGIDVSDYQGQVNWSAVAASGRQFAFAKATEGSDFVCETFPRNWAGIRAAGLVRGTYHFARPNDNTPNVEADWVLQHVGTPVVGDILCLDPEAGDGDLSSWALSWLQHVSERVGFRPVLYSGTWFLQPHGCTGNNDLAQYGLWLVAYQATMPTAPANWPFLAFWQHSQTASVPGVTTGGCDESFFNGDLAHLVLYGCPVNPVPNQPAPIPPAPAPPPPVPTSGDYVVRSGDVLGAIAVACHCSMQDLLAANPQISNPNLISVGEIIHLPSHSSAPTPGGATYVVQSGDNLSLIAARLGVSLLALERANPQLTDPSLIQPGNVLNVPS
jgi:lysozyme